MDYKEIRIDTLRNILMQVYGVYTTICIRDTFMPLETNAPQSDVLHALIYLDQDVRKTSDNRPFMPDKWYFYANSMGMIWVFAVDSERVYLLGPAFTDNYSVLDILDKLDKRQISKELKVGMMEFVRQIPIISTLRMQQYGMMLRCCLTSENLNAQDMVILGEGSQDNIGRSRSGESAANYSLEQKLWKAVREGNLNYRDELESAFNNIFPGKVANGQFLRQDKNMAIAQIALACRAAMEGGLNPEIAYYLSDQYIQKIESCTTVSEVANISAGVLDDYIQRVYQIKLRSGVSPQISACCDYISIHPEEKIDVQQFARKYGYAPYYFSKKFKQEIGMSIRDFAMVKKVERAKELLTSSTMSVSDISEFLGFNSQSYFGSIFRSITGMTPCEYQETGGANNKEARL